MERLGMKNGANNIPAKVKRSLSALSSFPARGFFSPTDLRVRLKSGCFAVRAPEGQLWVSSCSWGSLGEGTAEKEAVASRRQMGRVTWLLGTWAFSVTDTWGGTLSQLLDSFVTLSKPHNLSEPHTRWLWGLSELMHVKYSAMSLPVSKKL